MPSSPGTPRYRFSGHILSPARRTLVRDGQELPLIPRCFDLLVLLVERRNEAVSRHELLDAVWSDVVVTDGALSQAVRILRRTLGDDPREPTFIRTVQRHGYRFIRDDVVEEPDEGLPEPVPATTAEPVRIPTEPDADASFEHAFETLIEEEEEDEDDDEEGMDVRRRQAAETLHRLGTAEALDRLNRRKGHAVARAYLRETRWDVPGAGPVPLLGRPGWLGAARILFLLRIRRAARLAGRRWTAAAAGGAAAGAIAGVPGGPGLPFRPRTAACWRCCRLSEQQSAASRPRESGPVWPPRKPPSARGGGWCWLRPGHPAVWRSARPPTSWDASCSRVCSAAISRR